MPRDEEPCQSTFLQSDESRAQDAFPWNRAPVPGQTDRRTESCHARVTQALRELPALKDKTVPSRVEKDNPGVGFRTRRRLNQQHVEAPARALQPPRRAVVSQGFSTFNYFCHNR